MLRSIFDRVRAQLDEHGPVTYEGLFSHLAVQLAERKHPPFDFASVDQAQDIYTQLGKRPYR